MPVQRNSCTLQCRSIWDENLVNKHLNKVQSRKLWRYLIENNSAIELKNIPMTESSFSIPVKVVKEMKNENFSIFTSKIVENIGSNKDPTQKLLIELQDGNILHLF